MKKLLSILISVLLVINLCGCSLISALSYGMFSVFEMLGEEHTNITPIPSPVKPTTPATSVVAEDLPCEIVIKDYNGKVKSKIEIESVTYSVTDSYSKTWLNICLSGIKTYGDNSYDTFGYKIYDSEGYMVKSGSISLSGLEKGDKFKDKDITFYEAVPGESYTIKFTADWY